MRNCNILRLLNGTKYAGLCYWNHMIGVLGISFDVDKLCGLGDYSMTIITIHEYWKSSLFKIRGLIWTNYELSLISDCLLYRDLSTISAGLIKPLSPGQLYKFIFNSPEQNKTPCCGQPNNKKRAEFLSQGVCYLQNLFSRYHDF